VTDAQLYARMLDNLRSAFRIAARTPGGAALELDGVVAAITPAARYLSIFNGVVYTDAEALDAALPQLTRAYDAVGVQAWTVWIPEDDRAAAELVEAAGHALDASPRATACELAALDLAAPARLDYQRDVPVETFEALTMRGFGGRPEHARGALAGFDEERAHRYIAIADGEPAATVGVWDDEGDAGIYYVSTLPAARGRGLATALMTRALLDARERGCETTSLQATKMGRPVYARLGFRDLGAIEMWERRKAPVPTT